MKMITQPKTICLSDYGLKPTMTLAEVSQAIEKTKAKIGNKRFYEIAVQVYHNLSAMAPSSVFAYTEYFKNEAFDVFIVVAHRYICDHHEYEFTNDYTAIRRQDWTIAHQAIDKWAKRNEVQIE